jgi:hypothetical protein
MSPKLGETSTLQRASESSLSQVRSEHPDCPKTIRAQGSLVRNRIPAGLPATLRATVHHVVVGRSLVETREHRSCYERNVAHLIVVAHKTPHGGKVVKPHDGRELNLLVGGTPQQVDVAEPSIRSASIPGITSALTTDSYASAFCGVVHPRQIRQIMVSSDFLITRPHPNAPPSASDHCAER